MAFTIPGTNAELAFRDQRDPFVDVVLVLLIIFMLTAPFPIGRGGAGAKTRTVKEITEDRWC